MALIYLGRIGKYQRSHSTSNKDLRSSKRLSPDGIMFTIPYFRARSSLILRKTPIEPTIIARLMLKWIPNTLRQKYTIPKPAAISAYCSLLLDFIFSLHGIVALLVDGYGYAYAYAYAYAYSCIASYFW